MKKFYVPSMNEMGEISYEPTKLVQNLEKSFFTVVELNQKIEILLRESENLVAEPNRENED
jgi:uncharacterized small protein (DUF1192 family)